MMRHTSRVARHLGERNLVVWERARVLEQCCRTCRTMAVSLVSLVRLHTRKPKLIALVALSR